MVWAALGKAAMGGLKAGAKKVATNKLLNRKKKRPKKRASGKEMSGNMMNNDKEEQQKGGALAVRPSMGLVPTASDLDPVSTSAGESDIVIIRKQVIKVRDILKDTQSAKQAERKNLRKAKQVDEKKKEEDKIEKPKIKPTEAKAGMKVPNLGLGIGNFLAFLAAGIVFAKLNELMPTLKKIFGVLKVITKFIGGVLNFAIGFVVGFIDLAYAGVENLEKLIVAIGGEGAKETFEKFGKLFTQVINAALIAALIASRVGLFKKPKGPNGPKGPKPKWQKNLKKWWKKTPVGKFIRNQKAGWKRFTRKISRGPIGKTLKALRPKNVGKFIMEGGVDKALKGGVKNVTNFVRNPGRSIQNLTKKIRVPKNIQNLTKNIKPVQTIQNLTKNIKPVKTIQNLTKNIKPVKTLQNLNPFKGMNLGKKASNLLGSAKQLGSKALGGVDKWAKNQMGNLGSMWKGAKGFGAKIGGQIKNIAQLATDAPGKLRELVKSKIGNQIDDIVKKNKTLKNLLSMAKNPKKIGGAIKGILNTAKESKGILNVRAALSKAKAAKVGGVDKIIASVMALIDYMALKESPINAIVKAVSGMLGYAAGFAIGAPFGGVPGFITGMAGGALGELAGYGLLKGLANAPGTKGLTQVDDPIMNDGRPVLRDPDGPMDHMLNQPKESKGDGGSDARSEMKEKIERIKNQKKYGGTGGPIEYDGKVYKPGDEGYAEIVKSATSMVSRSQSEGLNMKPSYGDGVVVENTTTYIQPIEV